MWLVSAGCCTVLCLELGFYFLYIVVVVLLFFTPGQVQYKKKNVCVWGGGGVLWLKAVLVAGKVCLLLCLFCQHWVGIGETAILIAQTCVPQAKELIHYNSYQCTPNGYNSLVTTQQIAFAGSIGEFWLRLKTGDHKTDCNNGALCKPCFKLEEFALKRSGEFGQPRFEVGDFEVWLCKLWQSYFKRWGRTAQDWQWNCSKEVR